MRVLNVDFQNDVALITEGDKVGASEAALLNMLNISPFSYGLVLEKGKHYASMPMQYTAIFHGCKNDNFQMKFFNIFLIFAQNIDCG